MRQAVFCVSVPRSDRRLALELQHAPSGAALFVGEVKPGNAVVAVGVELKPDRLVAVSGLLSSALLS